jgi:hypothetical protein
MVVARSAIQRWFAERTMTSGVFLIEIQSTPIGQIGL